MKSTIWLVLALFVMFSACKKEDDDVDNDPVGGIEYYIEFRKDNEFIRYSGTETDYDHRFFGKHSVPNNAGDLYISSLGGRMDTHQLLKNSMGMILSYDEPIKINTIYTTDNSNIPGAIKSTLLGLSYTDDDDVDYLCSNVSNFIGLPSEGRLLFSEVTENFMAGSFSGIYYNSDNTKQISITEGKFKVRRIE